MNNSLTIGKLAKRTGITVRTLHHYDEIGLVTPSGRSSSGYRLYTVDDIARLHAVRVMQELGFSLSRIKEMLSDPYFSFRSVIGMQLAALQEKIRQEQELYGRLEELRRLTAAKRHVPMEDIIYLLQIMQNVKQFNLNPEDEEKLKNHWAQFRPADIKAVEAEWPKIIAEVREHMKQGTDPKDPAVQKLAARWTELVNMFTAGIPQMAETAKKNMEENYDSLKAQHGDGIPDKDMMGYIQKALE